MCDVLAEPENRGASRSLEVGPTGLGGPSPRTRLEGKSADTWQLLLLNDLMFVVCMVETVCTLLACGKREVNQVTLNLRRKWQKLSTFHLMLARE